MQESQLAGLLAMAAGAFAITAAIGNWDWFMKSRKAKAWVKRIGRDNARLMYGTIGALICVFGLLLVIIAPGGANDDPVVVEAEAPAPNRQTGSRGKPGRAAQTQSGHFIASTPTTSPVESSVPSTASADGSPPPTQPPIESGTPSSQPTSIAAATPTRPGGIPASTLPETAPVTVPTDGTDLLKLIDPDRDQLQGRWTIQNGALISPKDRPANLQLPLDAPASYRLSAVVELIDGNELFSIGLVVDGHGVAALLSGPGGDNCGLQRVDGKIARQNETYYRGAALGPGQNQIVCTVSQNDVRVDCNGQTIINWTGDPARLSSDSGDKFFVGSWNTSCRISRLTLAPLDDR